MPSITAQSTLHTVFSAECTTLFDWFSLAVKESFHNVGMRGPLTRLLACSDEQLREYQNLDIMSTFVHPNHRTHPSGDQSSSYNKPASVMHFARSGRLHEEYVLFIDADMIFARRFDISFARPGVVVSERVPYMANTTANLARAFLNSDVAARTAPVGWYHVFHREDLLRVAPLWLEYCGQIRSEPHRYWRIDGNGTDIATGDIYVKRGRPPWISEMHGYAFGAAVLGLEHHITEGAVLYPSFVSPTADRLPYLLHYGLPMSFANDNYEWHKGLLDRLDIQRCENVYIGPPPRGTLGSRQNEAMRLVINTLNTALYKHRRQRCPGTQRPRRERPPLCIASTCCGDRQHECWRWALGGECTNNHGFMMRECRFSCGLCTTPVVVKDIVYDMELLTLTILLVIVAVGCIGACFAWYAKTRRSAHKEV